jgi:branched-chain amino acid transport system ATP-binding protein
MLQIRDIHAHYGPSHVVQGIDLAAKPGEVIGIFGRNGVGKTTLLKTIAGWIRPSAGEIWVGERRIDGLSSDRICRAGVGFVPEDRRIFPGLTVEENMTLGFFQLPGRSGADKKAALEAAYLRFPRLKERRKQLGTTLSGGEQQMLAMARVMIGAPKLLLVDEPSEGLAPMIVAEIYATLVDMRRSGCIVLLVEQNVDKALEVCDRFVAIERGRVMLSGSAASTADREKLKQRIEI